MAPVLLTLALPASSLNLQSLRTFWALCKVSERLVGKARVSNTGAIEEGQANIINVPNALSESTHSGQNGNSDVLARPGVCGILRRVDGLENPKKCVLLNVESYKQHWSPRRDHVACSITIVQSQLKRCSVVEWKA